MSGFIEGEDRASNLFMIPLAYLAAITFRSPPAYIWAGFGLGFSVAAVLLTKCFQRISKEFLTLMPAK